MLIFCWSGCTVHGRWMCLDRNSFCIFKWVRVGVWAVCRMSEYVCVCAWWRLAIEIVCSLYSWTKFYFNSHAHFIRAWFPYIAVAHTRSNAVFSDTLALGYDEFFSPRRKKNSQKSVTSLLLRENRISVHVCFSSFPSIRTMGKKKSHNKHIRILRQKCEHGIECIVANVYGWIVARRLFADSVRVFFVFRLPIQIVMQLYRIPFGRNHLVHLLDAFFSIFCAIRCREVDARTMLEHDPTLVGHEVMLFVEIKYLAYILEVGRVELKRCSTLSLFSSS